MPTTSAAAQSIMMIILMTLVVGLCSRFWTALEVVGFWVIESRIMLKMTKRKKPITDAKRKNKNFLVDRHGWTNARTMATPARNASSVPGGLSSTPMAAAVNTNKPQITKRIIVTILLRGVENASIITTFFLVTMANSIYGGLTRLWKNTILNARIIHNAWFTNL